MALTRTEIVDAAVRLLQEHGLEGVTFRRIAAELGVSAPTLYWHVDSKRALLDLVAEELLRRHNATLVDRPPPGQPWWEWLEQRSRELFDALVETRDAPAVLAGNRPTPESLPQIEAALETLVDAGVPPADTQQALFAIGAYVIGSASEWQAEAARASDSPPSDARLAVALREGDFPTLGAALRGLVEQPPRATFEFGLRLLVDGLRARCAAGDPATGDTSASEQRPVRR
jgi:TetR/AcrR family transcriptional regulator, tetracycline repressor protein